MHEHTESNTHKCNFEKVSTNVNLPTIAITFLNSDTILHCTYKNYAITRHTQNI